MPDSHHITTFLDAMALLYAVVPWAAIILLAFAVLGLVVTAGTAWDTLARQWALWQGRAPRPTPQEEAEAAWDLIAALHDDLDAIRDQADAWWDTGDPAAMACASDLRALLDGPHAIPTTARGEEAATLALRTMHTRLTEEQEKADA